MVRIPLLACRRRRRLRRTGTVSVEAPEPKARFNYIRFRLSWSWVEPRGPSSNKLLLAVPSCCQAVFRFPLPQLRWLAQSTSTALGPFSLRTGTNRSYPSSSSGHRSTTACRLLQVLQKQQPKAPTHQAQRIGGIGCCRPRRPSPIHPPPRSPPTGSLASAPIHPSFRLPSRHLPRRLLQPVQLMP